MKIEYLHTRLAERPRFIVVFLCYILAAFFHALTLWGNHPWPLFSIAGFFFLVIPLWFLKVRSFSNRPGKHISPDGEGCTWKPVTMTELDRVRGRIGAVKKVKVPFIYSLSFGIIFTCFFPCFFIPANAIFGIRRGFPVFDLYLILFPFLWFAKIDKWFPEQLDGKLAAFEPVFKAALPETLRLSLMMLRGGEEDEAPRDLRLMLEPGPAARQEVRDELLGAQFQVTFNKGPNGEVPYMYAVFITKGRGKVWQSLKNLRHGRYATESGSSRDSGTEYGTIVVRLDTESRSDGYHTKRSDVEELVDIVISELVNIL